MPSFLFEQPWIIGGIGTVLSVITIFGWVQSGNAIALRSACGLIVATVALVLLNLWVVTDREVVRAWLLDTAERIQRNEFEGDIPGEKIQMLIHPDASERTMNYSRILPNIKFTMAKITKIHSIEIDAKRNLTKAVVRMNVFVEAESKYASGKTPRWVGLTLVKKDDKWLITDFEAKEPQHEFMKSRADVEWPPR
jgi:hypothetical protein